MRVAVRGRREQFVVLGLLFVLALLHVRRDSDSSVKLPYVYHYPANSSAAQSPAAVESFNRPPLLLSPRHSHPANPPLPNPMTPNPPQEPYTKALVIARTKNEDPSWLNDTLDGGVPITTGWDVLVYTTDDLSAAHHTPVNKGREAMAYLTYLINHYAVLPEIILFMHSHRLAWHDNHLISLSSPTTLVSLHLPRVARLGYMNLRCPWEPGCPAHIYPSHTDGVDPNKPEEAVFASAWGELFPPDVAVPEVLSQACCAQFAVSRERVLGHPVSVYVGWRDWLLGTELGDQISGRVMEYLYQVLWTGGAVVCPAEWSCYCEGYGVCFGGREGFEGFVRGREERDVLRGRVEEMVGREGEVVDGDAPGHADGYSRRAEDQQEGSHADDVVDETEASEEVSEPEGEPPPAETLKLPSPETLEEIALLSEQIDELDRWLEQELAAARDRGRDPYLRSLEADGEVSEK
ncbi:hypothetical protein CONLIGDRAFT_643637 [Coniochaeta ligniaria NRRL 30616]|uniref:DUF3431 domain-containing protein n=1 Tax=Coniochaeta ligniaria NRRL 30616 TaxID=1408157 RepID=A0A1J7JIE7_9PEZI|nr:hypothetical protein CONLIGDRAFT_643637 [Coniochaeta ligniaria NRRL 30616]